MISSKVDGRGVSRTIAHTNGKMVIDETTPGSVGAQAEGLTETPIRSRRSAVDNRSQSRKQIALEHLALARKEFESAVESRVRFILLARDYGNTNAEIGAVLGVGESAVRSMIQRHGEA